MILYRDTVSCFTRLKSDRFYAIIILSTKRAEDMKKDIITIEHVKNDLLKIVKFQLSNKLDWRFIYIIPLTAMAVLVGILLESALIGAGIFSFAVYHIIRLILEYKEIRARKKAVLSIGSRADISVSTEIFSHIATDGIYEPHWTGKRNTAKKLVTLYHFSAGSSWRAPAFVKYYEWSRDFYISPKGLQNISIPGDEFFFISLQKHLDISFIYPCKNFELDKSLREQVSSS